MLQKLMGELSVKRVPQPVALAPSNIHFLLLEHLNCQQSPATPAANLPCLHYVPKLQVVHKDNAWFALNSAHLHLFRTLEQANKCSKVLVDVVSLQRVPPELRRLMIIEPNPSKVERKDIGRAKEDFPFDQLINDNLTEPRELYDTQSVVDKEKHKERPQSFHDTEAAAGVQTAKGYHPVVQRDPNDDVISEQSNYSDTGEGSSEESESDSVQSETGSELGFSSWSDEEGELTEEEDTEDEEDFDSNSSHSGSSSISCERLGENESLL